LNRGKEETRMCRRKLLYCDTNTI